MAVFRPSAQVRLQLRLDEGPDVVALRSRLRPISDGSGPTEPTGGLPGTSLLKSAAAGAAAVQKSLTTLASVRDLLTPEQQRDLEADYRAAKAIVDSQQSATSVDGGTEQPLPGALQEADSDLLIIGGVQPVSATIERNGLQDADTCEVEVDYRDCPVDPRSIRAAFVEVVLGTVPATDFELGLDGGLRPDGSLLSVVQRSEGQDRRLGSTTSFLGFVDEWDSRAGEGGDTIILRCRDVTALLSSKKLPQGVTIDLTLPIADGVAELLNKFPSMAQMQVVFGTPSDDPTTKGGRGPKLADSMSRATKPRRGQKAARARQGSREMSVWDHITDTVLAAGFTPILRGYTLFIARPRTFWSQVDTAKRLVYGRNLKELTFARKLAADTSVPVLEVRCYNPEIDRTMWARAPKPAPGLGPSPPMSGIIGKSDPPKAPSKPNRVQPGGAVEEEIQVVTLEGVQDLDALERYADSIWQQYSRQEIEGSFATDDITSFEGDDGDLLNLQPGDAVEVTIAPLNAASNQDSTNTMPKGSVNSLQELATMSAARRAAYLEDLGWPRKVAQRIAAVNEQNALQTTFRVGNVRVRFSTEDGVEISGDFINFIVVREDSGSQADPSAQASALVGDSTSAAANAVRERDAAGGTLRNAAKAGQIAPGPFAEQDGENNAGLTRAAQTTKRTG